MLGEVFLRGGKINLLLVHGQSGGIVCAACEYGKKAAGCATLMADARHRAGQPLT
jgi:hypothetical protein